MPLSYDPDLFQLLEPLLPLPRLPAHDIDGRRQRRIASEARLVVPEAQGVLVDTLTIRSFDGAEVEVLRVYPEAETAAGVITSAWVHAHGGGMIMGSARSGVGALTHVVAETRIPVFSVNYRKAPEHRYPIPVEDMYAALTWILENASTYLVDPTRIGVTGESSGGCLAAGVAIMARDRGLNPPLKKQVLIYPMLDDRNTVPISGVEELAFWKADDALTAWTAYLGDTEHVSPYAAPTRVESVEGLPSLYVEVGELDILKTEIVGYVSRFLRANISTECHVYPGLPHAWELLAPKILPSVTAFANRYRALSDL